MGEIVFKVRELIKGVYELVPHIHQDNRGLFIKTFHYDEFKKIGLDTDFKEEYYSVSKRNVLRGMHFQLPPFDHNKIVYCIYGRVLDVVVDIRKNSGTFGKVISLELSSEKANIIYISKGFAHGFYTLSNKAIMLYKTSTVYNPNFDTGILWSSINFDWPCKRPIISERDRKFITLNEFKVKGYYV
jgi:dTDP-4-dehydrorhamnose 3,5-epimerase